ncbi:DUF6881 domain-containing protein [Actinokineospora terrae]|uniref:DUF6881 domain-containing protein n=1 Tax=Actinokineospora terrae TaxID=155974 RepID=A0A1H9KBA4_9PSEU|nr:hypothetical protein [Actinokineospora terrae]SEQ96424.1 hypothetical protein SAMN04487818_101103 [Actinokineospora terrae]
MRYLKTHWHHDHPDEPVLIYSEIDADRAETRKVEVYRDGRHDWADERESTGSTFLAEVDMPDDEEFAAIAADPEFSPEWIERAEFEQAWAKARER